MSLPLWNWIFVTYPITSVVCISLGKAQVPYWRFLAFYPKCFLCLQSQQLLCVWDKSQSHPHNLLDVLATKEISLPVSVHRVALATVVLSIRTPCQHCWVTLNLGIVLGPGKADLPILRLQQLGSGMHLHWEGGPCDPHGNKVCPKFWHQIVRSAVPKWLLEISLKHWGAAREATILRSQQARQNLLLQKGAHWAGGPQGFYLPSCCPFSCPWIGKALGSQAMWLANLKRASLGGRLWGSDNWFWLSAPEPGHLAEFLLPPRWR
jgi:hypothetical protein